MSSARSRAVASSASGLVLGMTSDGPMVLRVFRPRATRVVASIPVGLALVLTVRAAAVGAHVQVRTDRRGDWRRLAALATACGGPEVLRPTAAVSAGGVANRPSFVLDHPAAEPLSLGPWQTHVAWIPDAEPASVDALRVADLALVATPDDRALDRLAYAHGLTDDQVNSVRQASRAGVVVSVPRRITAVAMEVTALERELIGT